MFVKRGRQVHPLEIAMYLRLNNNIMGLARNPCRNLVDHNFDKSCLSNDKSSQSYHSSKSVNMHVFFCGSFELLLAHSCSSTVHKRYTAFWAYTSISCVESFQNYNYHQELASSHICIPFVHYHRTVSANRSNGRKIGMACSISNATQSATTRNHTRRVACKIPTGSKTGCRLPPHRLAQNRP